MSLKGPETRYQILAQKWLDGTIAPEEKKEFADWYNQNQDTDVFIPESYGLDETQHRARLLANIQSQIEAGRDTKVMPLFRPSIAAAVLLLLLGIGAYFLFSQKATHEQKQDIAVVEDVAPGTDKATLTLGDGSVLKLDELADGAVKEDNGFRISKKSGEIIYEKIKNSSGQLTYNTIRTPRGGQFKVTLPDGSKVWLNSESSLRYPTVFGNEERFVSLTGEGYFEVAKMKLAKRKVSFKINVSNKEHVEVLGTHFNIMAYSDEHAIKTTLLEGSVRVSRPGTKNESLLKPGQQSVYHASRGFEIRKDIDVEESISWKNGLISFKDADIQTIMRQVERWYDVRVEYQGEVSKRLFTGGISRNSKLSSLLKVLEMNNIHFKIKGKIITVIP